MGAIERKNSYSINYSYYYLLGLIRLEVLDYKPLRFTLANSKVLLLSSIKLIVSAPSPVVILVFRS